MLDDELRTGEIDRLPLERYGLTHLEGADLLRLEGEDLDRLLEALARDDISINIPLPCTQENIDNLLAAGECRRCGRCCIPNPLIPDGPGVEIFIEELREVERYLGQPENAVFDRTTEGKIIPHPLKGHITFTRWLPLPCPFHTAEPDGCRVHPVRPVVCRIHPIVFTGDISYMAVKVRCDYGKDIARAAFKLVRETDPEMEIRL